MKEARDFMATILQFGMPFCRLTIHSRVTIPIVWTTELYSQLVQSIYWNQLYIFVGKACMFPHLIKAGIGKDQFPIASKVPINFYEFSTGDLI